ncbi:MAG: Tfp pilus assembly protein, ATPase PilM [Candidatus Daviesbacteria bacterium GW2011_GWF2_38_6]|uniref:Tfp pilus assembly protein, ATPase PilM n=1 Tax=Candidatus Daviesbacteria bacterium GW2011_GWF2_38_6 TaxID=1618432 RepID=A0A0G0KCD0_9BACT|nr:MAG: Tfp pilus assembly protein, ATPase PilM [Candidatus Daviesbacteria bacterium GW2011_GWF2_38_6]
MAKLSVGLDIGFFSIKAVSLISDKDQYRLNTLGVIPTPQPGMVSEQESDLEALADAIKKLLTTAKIDTKDVIIALPESKVFTRVIDDLPYLTDQELKSAIRYASEEFIPMPLSDVNLNWQVLARSDGKNKNARTIVLVIASPKNVVNKYMKVLSMAGLRAKALETFSEQKSFFSGYFNYSIRCHNYGFCRGVSRAYLVNQINFHRRHSVDAAVGTTI